MKIAGLLLPQYVLLFEVVLTFYMLVRARGDGLRDGVPLHRGPAALLLQAGLLDFVSSIHHRIMC